MLDRCSIDVRSICAIPPNSSLALMGIVPPMAWMGMKRERIVGEIFESWGRIGRWMQDDLERLGEDMSMENRSEIYLKYLKCI